MKINFWKWERISRKESEQPYLLRLVIFRCVYFGLYLHWFEGDDDSCQHDHPFRFLTFILAGGYYETTPRGTRWYGPGSLLARPAKWRHRITVKPGTLPLTILLAGPRLRRWGFWTPFGWIFWKDYHHSQHCPE